MKQILIHLHLLSLVSWCLVQGARDRIGSLDNPDLENSNGYEERRESGLNVPYDPGNVDSDRKPADRVDKNRDKEYCYEFDRKYTPIISRNIWDRRKQRIVRTHAAAEILVVRDGGDSCSTKTECLASIQSEKMPTPKKECSFRENFYIGGDGSVIEGRGWNVAPYWYLQGLRNMSITVKFLGSYQSQLPSFEATNVFQHFVASGVRSGNISKEYKIVTMSQLLNDKKYLGEKLQENVVSWEGWVNESVVSEKWEYSKPYLPRFVFRRQWNALEPSKKLNSMSSKVKYVVISNGGKRCHDQEMCICQIKLEQENKIHQYGDVLDNFYIGDDGSIYEGRGWKVSPHWFLKGLNSSYVSVRFLGSFQAELPSEKAISAFKWLLRSGITVGEISSEFRFISLRQIYNKSSFLGDALNNHVKRWEPWSTVIDRMSVRDLWTLGVLPIINRSVEYEVYDGVCKIRDLTAARHGLMHYVLLREGGEECFTLKECQDAMDAEKKFCSPKYADVLDNFYIGSDGNIYEGRGWDSSPHFYLKYFNDSHITVRFFGTFGNTQPSELAILAFDTLINIGIALQKISINYQLYSFRHVYDDPTFLGNSLNEHFENLRHWSTHITLMTERERAASGLLPLIYRHDWEAKLSVRHLGNLKLPVQYVVVGEAGGRCYTHEECIYEIRKEENYTSSLYGYVSDNFYIGEDGLAYEGRGWAADLYSKLEGAKRNSIFVSFFGTFELSLPSELALTSFRRLLKYGVNTGYVAKNYKILSLRQLCNCTFGVGESLYRSIRKWNRFSDSSNLTPDLLPTTSEKLAMVPRSRWNATSRYNVTTTSVPPAEYIAVIDGGHRCFSREQCTSEIQSSSNIPKYGVDIDNFFVGEDGYVYEGLGWDVRPFRHINCTVCNFIALRFLGSFQSVLPKPSAANALQFLIRWGNELGKLSHDYKIISFNQVCDNRSLLGEKLDHSVRTWDRWSENINITANCSFMDNRIIRSLEWRSFSTFSSSYGVKLKTVYVHNWGERCYTIAHCTTILHGLNEFSGIGVLENFFIGDDGNVYEGRGWYEGPLHEFGNWGSTINVHFFGSFEDEPLSTQAISAFKDILLKEGMDLGVILFHYEIRPVPDHFYAIPPDGRRYVRSKKAIITTRQPIEFIVIRDGGKRCSSKKECFANLMSERIANASDECSLQENFFIGSDGKIYEGRGWDVASYWFLKGIRNESITVKFLGNYQEELPPPRAKRALDDLILIGVWLRKLMAEYKIITMQQLSYDRQFTGDKLHEDVINWEGWVNDSVPQSLWEYEFPYPLKFVFRAQWTASEPTVKFDIVVKPVSNILMGSWGDRCYTRQECISQIKSLQDSQIHDYGDVLENFYIGDDGSVYEGRGWRFAPHWYIDGLKNSYVSVCFLGDFQSEIPSDLAIAAFKSLVMVGAKLGMVSQQFEFLSLQLIYSVSSLFGDAITRYVRKWTPWSRGFDLMAANEIWLNGIRPLITYSDRKEKLEYDRLPNATLPIQYVIVRDDGDSCFTITDCKRLMESEEKLRGKTHGKILENFYIGYDGNIYEGLGWYPIPHLHLKYINHSHITVKFLGSTENIWSHKLLLAAFSALLHSGVQMGIISPDHKLYSYRHIYNDSSFLGDNLSRQLESMEHWSSKLDDWNEDDRASWGLLPIAFRADWNATPLVKTYKKLNRSIEYVIVGSIGAPCFTHKQCVRMIQTEQNSTVPLFGDMPDNFYIGGNGVAYEGSGWTFDPYSQVAALDRNAIFVRFFGRFEQVMPTKLALSAFNRLLKYALRKRKLAQNYKVISIRQMCAGNEPLSDTLHDTIKTWEKYSYNVNTSSLSERTSYGRAMIIPRSAWNATDSFSTQKMHTHAATYVIVLESGDRCFTREDCSSTILTAESVRKYGVEIENFFVGEDGAAYEGLGWDIHAFWNDNCTKCKSISVRFVGEFKDELPNSHAMYAFNYLIKLGIVVGKISPNFKLITLNQLCQNQSPLGDALDRSVKTWDHWSDDIDISINCNVLENQIIRISEWGGYLYFYERPIKSPIKHVAILNEGTRCFTPHQCTAYLKGENRRSWMSLKHSFYIGDDGHVYEARGWILESILPHGKPSINVVFIGGFQNDLPSKRAVNAFKSVFVSTALELGKLLPDFEIEPAPKTSSISEKLKENLHILH